MQLKNKTEREQFLANYKTWGVWKEVPELELKFYRYELPNGTVIIATEYASMQIVRWDGYKGVYKKGTDVTYHLRLSEGDKFKNTCYIHGYKLYNPTGDEICFENCQKDTGNKFECKFGEGVPSEKCVECIQRWLESECEE